MRGHDLTKTQGPSREARAVHFQVQGTRASRERLGKKDTAKGFSEFLDRN